VRAWLYRIATNRSLDALRASRRRADRQRLTAMPEPTRYAMIVLTLRGDGISAITWFGGASVCPDFELPQALDRAS
jgi:DNA-directed RNA polymerase specialized sigma24 family protein